MGSQCDDATGDRLANQASQVEHGKHHGCRDATIPARKRQAAARDQTREKKRMGRTSHESDQGEGPDVTDKRIGGGTDKEDRHAKHDRRPDSHRVRPAA